MAGVARRAKELSESFAKNGHQVTVLTSFPRAFRSMPNYIAKEYELINKVRVIRIKTIFSVGKNILFRLLSYFFYVIRCMIYIIKNNAKYDLIISMAPLPPAIAGSLANKIYKKYHHFDVPDILPDLGISAGMLKNKILIKFLFNLEKWVYKNTNSISAVTDGQITNIINKGISKDKLHLIPDWIDNDFFRTNLKEYKYEIKKQLDYDSKILISFVGNIGKLQNPKTFLKLLDELNKVEPNKFQLLFIGDGIMLPSLIKRSKKLKLDNITFVGRVDRKLVPAYMNLSDILVANYLPNDYLDICIPGKLFEYAISNKPIIMGSKGEAKHLIEKYRLGCSVNPSDIEGFKKAVLKISSRSYKHMPDIDDFINDYSLANVSNKYERIINN